MGREDVECGGELAQEVVTVGWHVKERARVKAMGRGRCACDRTVECEVRRVRRARGAAGKAFLLWEVPGRPADAPVPPGLECPHEWFGIDSERDPGPW